MKVSNNIHNIACLEDVEYIQEWTEIEKIPIKASPVTPVVPPKKEEEKKEGEQPATEGEKPAEEKPAEPQPVAPEPEQQYESKERKKKTFS